MSDPRGNLHGPAVNTVNGPTVGRDRRELEATHHIGRLGPSLIHCFFGAGRIVQVHDLGNRAVQRVLSKFMEVLRGLTEIDGRVSVRIATDLLLINDVRVVVDPQSMGPFLCVIDQMKKREVEEIEFMPETTAPELGRFLKLFFGAAADEDVFGELSRRVTDMGITYIKLTERIERAKRLGESTENRREILEESNKAYSRTVLFMGETLRAIEQQRAIQVCKAQRLTLRMADIVQIDESVLVGLASIKNYDEYTFAHSVNVCILSMLIADRAGLHKSDVAQLGVSGLLHDIGKTHVPQAILNKSGKLTDEEWELMEQHTMFGVKELSRVRSLRTIADALFVTLQHHVRYNKEGYPQKPGEWELPPSTRIVTVADCFDAMTTPRVYRTDPLTPDKALRFIHDKSGEIFDPFIARVFMQAMGIYPVGTVVELDTGEKAVVLRQNRRTRLMHRPVVALLDRNGPGDEPIDLAERLNNGTGYRHIIVRSVHDVAAEARKASCFVVK